MCENFLDSFISEKEEVFNKKDVLKYYYYRSSDYNNSIEGIIFSDVQSYYIRNYDIDISTIIYDELSKDFLYFKETLLDVLKIKIKIHDCSSGYCYFRIEKDVWAIINSYINGQKCDQIVEDQDPNLNQEFSQVINLDQSGLLGDKYTNASTTDITE